MQSRTTAEDRGAQPPPEFGPQLLAEGLDRIYAPVREGLGRVRDTLKGLPQEQLPFMTALLDHILDPAGKQVRPAITLLASRFHTNDGRAAEIMASAIELLHIATLIHDDTVDSSDFRHGKATVSSKWGRNVAVLLGDHVFATSATFVCDTGNIRVIRRFSETIMELSAGELNQLAGAFDYRQSREQYLHRIYCKTASLFTTAAESGAVLSGASEDKVQALKAYGYNLGMAFQIADDILDFEGSHEETGKPVGSDLAQGILTLPAIIAMERNPDHNPIQALCRRPADSEALTRAVDLVQDPAIIDEAFAVAGQFSRKALESLDKLERNGVRDSLARLVPSLVRRHD